MGKLFSRREYPWGPLIQSVFLVTVCAGMVLGCNSEEGTSDVGGAAMPTAGAGGGAAGDLDLSHAIAILQPTEGNSVSGQVTFTQTDEGVRIQAHVEGLSPGKHGFHIHEFGDLTAADGTSTGGHFNPDGVDHAAPDSKTRHVGDLGNLDAGADGVADYDRVDMHLSLHGEKAVLSRGVVIHAGEDDLTSQPTGAAGGRQAVGVIGLGKSD